MAKPDGKSSSGPDAARLGRPGELSLLLEELARAPEDELAGAWNPGLRPGDTVGRFEILKEVGRGGFGVVYAALDRELGRSVAFKTLRPARTTHEVSGEWIRKEAEAVARLDHPAIVTLYDAGRCEAGPYLVEELLRGETLQGRLRRGALGPAEVASIGLDIARALAHAHRRGVLHRDLKPGNVFLTDEGRVKLLDFGLAHLLGTRGVQGAGTPAYMAPELFRGEEGGPRSDVFALGVTLFEALAGRRPFDATEERSAAEGPAPVLPDGTPRALATVVMSCLERDPERRPKGAQAVVEALIAAQQAITDSSRERSLGTRRAFEALPGRSAFRAISVIVLAAAAIAAAVLATASRSRPGTAAADALPAPAPANAAGASASIAVLPFADLSPQRDQEYFADGVAEEILNGLAHVRGLKVIGRTSSFSFKGKGEDLRTIGRKLDVAHLLEGSLRKDGTRIRVSAKLVRAADGVQLWSESYDRTVSGIFDVQDEIARAVVAALQARLPVQLDGMPIPPAPTSAEAYDRYLDARQLLARTTAATHRRAAASLERALAIDPSYAPAWAALADALNLGAILGAGEPGALIARARRAADRAVAIAPELSAAYAARAMVRQNQWDWEGARADAERAVALEPGAALPRRRRSTIVQEITGDAASAIEELRQLTVLDPLSANGWFQLGNAYRRSGQILPAREAYLRALELDPEHQWAVGGMFMLEVDAGNLSDARRWAERQEFAIDRESLGPILDAARGDRAAARAGAERLAREHGDASPTDVAAVYAKLGEPDLAFEWLDRALARRTPTLRWVKLTWAYQPLHGDPRWRRFLERMKLPVE